MKALLRFAIAAVMMLAAATVSAANPVTCRVQAPARVKAGESFAVSIILDIQDGWHIYAPTEANTAQGVSNTRIEFMLPNGVLAGPLELPGHATKGTFDVYAGSGIGFIRKFRAIDTGDAPSKSTIKGRITYQVCNAEMCLPPRTDNFSVVIDIEKSTTVPGAA